MLNKHVPTRPLEANLPPPPHHLGSGRKPEKVHCMALLQTLYNIHTKKTYRAQQKKTPIFPQLFGFSNFSQ
jgi:hypothetical protein